ncbi:MAG: InlB B-repeat-containing protein, partial [Oscillospiraceae bacterium]|nr:InlB B-repeat-containing protein [Oscillospiraceae bacterium]
DYSFLESEVREANRVILNPNTAASVSGLNTINKYAHAYDAGRAFSFEYMAEGTAQNDAPVENTYSLGNGRYYVVNSYGTNISLPVPNRSGYVFKGYTNGTGSNSAQIDFAPDSHGFITYSGSGTADVNLYARWGYKVNYNANGGTGTMLSDDGLLDSNPYALKANSFINPGYKFLGWSTSQASATAEYAEGSTWSNPPAPVNGEVTLYAVWQKNLSTYAVTYIANGGTGAPEAQVKTENIDLTLSAVIPTPPHGKVFVGWYTAANGSGTFYAPGSVYTQNAALTLYANFAAEDIAAEPAPPQIKYATIKTTADANSQALRFYTALAPTPAGYALIEYGTVFIPTQKLSAADTPIEKNMANSVTAMVTVSGNPAYNGFYSSLNGLPGANLCGVRISARSYAIYKAVDGGELTGDPIIKYSVNNEAQPEGSAEGTGKNAVSYLKSGYAVGVKDGVATRSINGIARFIAQAVIANQTDINRYLASVGKPEINWVSGITSVTDAISSAVEDTDIREFIAANVNAVEALEHLPYGDNEDIL